MIDAPPGDPFVKGFGALCSLVYFYKFFPAKRALEINP